jgi:hypothetical protein
MARGDRGGGSLTAAPALWMSDMVEVTTRAVEVEALRLCPAYSKVRATRPEPVRCQRSVHA